MPLTFSEFFRSIAPTPASLHLTHCTGMILAIAVLERLALVPSRCQVYGEDLLYLTRPGRRGAGSPEDER